MRHLITHHLSPKLYHINRSIVGAPIQPRNTQRANTVSRSVCIVESLCIFSVFLRSTKSLVGTRQSVRFFCSRQKQNLPCTFEKKQSLGSRLSNSERPIRNTSPSAEHFTVRQMLARLKRRTEHSTNFGQEKRNTPKHPEQRNTRRMNILSLCCLLAVAAAVK